MKKILLLLVGMFAYIQLVDAQTVCRRKELANNKGKHSINYKF